MTLRQTVEQLASGFTAKGARGRPPSAVWEFMLPRPPVVPRLADAATRIAEKFDTPGEPPPPVDLAALIKAFREAAAVGTLDRFLTRQWRQVVWGLWDGADALADDPAFMAALLARISDPRSRPLCKALIGAYLANFDASRDSVRRVGEALAARVTKWNWDWADRQRDVHLFDADRAPAAAADRARHGSSPLAERLASVGLRGVVRFGGMEAAAFRASLATLKEEWERGSDDRAFLDHILAWAVRDDGALTFASLRGALAETLLTPWRDRAPAEDLRQRITDFLLKHFKDPRLHPGNWMGVSEEATAVLRRWLTGAALEQFFAVVDNIAEKGHWMYRRPFWMSYYKNNVIDDAWVIFGPRATDIAEQFLESNIAYGRLEQYRLKNHSVILLRIAGLTVADVSHSGRCRVWKNGNIHAPVLYRRAYVLDEVENRPDMEQSHHNSEGFSWQNKVADFIGATTGVVVPRHEWEPDRGVLFHKASLRR